MNKKNSNEMNCRLALLRELLQDYKKTYEEMEALSATIKNMSGSCFSSIFNRNLPEIQEKLSKHKSNLERTTQINDEITTSVNSWYEFVKNPEEVSLLLFPLRFRLKGKAFKKSLKVLNDELSSIVIENRFITEQVTIWEHKLETDVIIEIRGSEAYSDFEKASSQLETITVELKYLVPSIPGLCPVDINPSSIDRLVEKLQHFEAA